MTQTDGQIAARLAGYAPETLAAWYSLLNGFTWPSDFPVEKPDGFDAAPTRQRDGSVIDRYTLLRPVMTALQALTTPEARSRAWWRHIGSSEEAWQAWWDSEGEAFHREVDAVRQGGQP